MRYIAGIDIGNSSTEVALAKVSEEGHLTILTSSLAETTGIKGTLRNVFGIEEALSRAATQAGISVSDISLIQRIESLKKACAIPSIHIALKENTMHWSQRIPVMVEAALADATLKTNPRAANASAICELLEELL